MSQVGDMVGEWMLNGDGTQTWWENTVTGESVWELPNTSEHGDYSAPLRQQQYDGQEDGQEAWQEDVTGGYYWNGNEWVEAGPDFGLQTAALYDFTRQHTHGRMEDQEEYDYTDGEDYDYDQEGLFADQAAASYYDGYNTVQQSHYDPHDEYDPSAGYDSTPAYPLRGNWGSDGEWHEEEEWPAEWKQEEQLVERAEPVPAEEEVIITDEDMDNDMEKHSDNDIDDGMVEGKFTVKILRAHGLRQANEGSQVDSFCELGWLDEDTDAIHDVILVTEVVDDSQDPEWGGEEASKSTVEVLWRAHSRLCIQVFDDDPLGGKEFLGRAIIPRSLIREASIGTGGGVRVVELEDQLNDRGKIAKGSIEFAVEPIGGLSADGAKIVAEAREGEWLEVTDEASGGVYFFNSVTHETTWERPVASEGPDGPTIGTLGSFQEASKFQLNWPVTDTFITHALRRYVDQLRAHKFKDRDLKKYMAYLKEGIELTGGSERMDGDAWVKRDAETVEEMMRLVREGKDVAEAEEYVLKTLRLWHEHGPLTDIPLHSNDDNETVEAENDTLRRIGITVVPPIIPGAANGGQESRLVRLGELPEAQYSDTGMHGVPPVVDLSEYDLYPWQRCVTVDEHTGKEVEYFYNVENKRTSWDPPLEGFVWERKLKLLEQLTPRYVSPADVARKVATTSVRDPNKWTWRETNEEKRRRQKYIRMNEREQRKEEKRRRENPTDSEQLEDTLEWLISEVVRRDERVEAKRRHRQRKKDRLAWHASVGDRHLYPLPTGGQVIDAALVTDLELSEFASGCLLTVGGDRVRIIPSLPLSRRGRIEEKDETNGTQQQQQQQQQRRQHLRTWAYESSHKVRQLASARLRQVPSPAALFGQQRARKPLTVLEQQQQQQQEEESATPPAPSTPPLPHVCEDLIEKKTKSRSLQRFDAAMVTLELACLLPPRIEMKPNPDRPENMSTIAKAVHEHKKWVKQQGVRERTGYGGGLSVKSGGPLMIADSTRRHRFEQTLVSDVAKALSCEPDRVVIEEISGSSSQSFVPGRGQWDVWGTDLKRSEATVGFMIGGMKTTPPSPREKKLNEDAIANSETRQETTPTRREKEEDDGGDGSSLPPIAATVRTVSVDTSADRQRQAFPPSELGRVPSVLPSVTELRDELSERLASVNRRKLSKDGKDRTFVKFTLLGDSEESSESLAERLVKQVVSAHTQTVCGPNERFAGRSHALIEWLQDRESTEQASAVRQPEEEEGGIAYYFPAMKHTPLLAGTVTCATLAATSQPRSKQFIPDRWEGFWCHCISPVYFGRESTVILTKEAKRNRPRKPKEKTIQRVYHPVDRLAAAESRFKHMTKQGLVKGHDGLEHMTPEQKQAEAELERALLHLRLYDATERRRQATLDGKQARERVARKRFTQAEVDRIVRKAERDGLAERKRKAQASTEAREQRRRDAAKQRVVRQMEVWVETRLAAHGNRPKMFTKVLAAEEGKRRKEEMDRIASGEITPEDVARMAEDEKSRLKERVHTEYRLRELFRDLAKVLAHQQNDSDNNNGSSFDLSTVLGSPVPTAEEEEEEKDRKERRVLLKKRDVYEALSKRSSDFFKRCLSIKPLKVVVTLPEFQQCFFLHPVRTRKGCVTQDEFVLFALSVMTCMDKYLAVKKKFEEFSKKKQQSSAVAKKNSEKERQESERELEEKRSSELHALRDRILQTAKDPHEMEDAWAKFHIHIIVQPVRQVPAYCCTCRRRHWEQARNARLAVEKKWRDGWETELNRRMRVLAPLIHKQVNHAFVTGAVGKKARRESLRSQVELVLDRMLDEVEQRAEREEREVLTQVDGVLQPLVSKAMETGLVQRRGMLHDRIQSVDRELDGVADDREAAERSLDALQRSTDGKATRSGLFASRAKGQEAALLAVQEEEARIQLCDRKERSLQATRFRLAVFLTQTDKDIALNFPELEVPKAAVDEALVSAVHEMEAGAREESEREMSDACSLVLEVTDASNPDRGPISEARLTGPALLSIAKDQSNDADPVLNLPLRREDLPVDDTQASNTPAGFLDLNKHSLAVVVKRSEKLKLQQMKKLKQQVKEKEALAESEAFGSLTISLVVTDRADTVPIEWKLKVLRARDVTDGKLDEDALIDPQVTVKWNGDVIGRTPPAPITRDPEWDTPEAEFLLSFQSDRQLAGRRNKLKTMFKRAQFGALQALALERQAQSRMTSALDESTARARMLLQREESERRLMALEEERTRRLEELRRRVVEKKGRDFQEKGHRLFLQGLSRLTNPHPLVRKLQWVRAWAHSSADLPLTSQVRDPSTGNIYLCRLLTCQYREDVSNVMRELNDLEDVRHANLMRVLHASSYHTPIASALNGAPLADVLCVAIITEFCPMGQVAARCEYESHPKVNDVTMVKWARDVCAGLRALHRSGLTHRNLNPRNVHVNAKGQAVVSGFMCLKTPRIANDEWSFRRNDCGSSTVIAPEVEDGHPVTPAADIWALGCCLYAWMTSEPDLPIGAMRDRPLDKLVSSIPRRFGTKLRSAIRMCLQHHPSHRASADDLWKLAFGLARESFSHEELG